MTVVAIFIFFALFILLTTAIRLLRPTPLSAATAISFAALIALESTVLNVLSIFQLITLNVMVGFHLIVILVLVVIVVRLKPGIGFSHIRQSCRLLGNRLVRIRNPIFLPLLMIICITAWLYPPNNYDSLTYHMARVVHWMQNQSVDYYPTSIDRQNVMSPGVEYIFLLFQIITHTDRLANFVQLFAYIILIPACFYICRVLKIPNKFSLFVVMLTTTAPIVILQASNTKNDIVAALMMYAVLISSRRFFAGQI